MWIKQSIKIPYQTALHIIIYSAMLVMLILLITEFTVSGTTENKGNNVSTKSTDNKFTKR